MKRFIRVVPVIASLLGAALFVGCANEATSPSTPEFARTRPSYITSCEPQPYAYSAGWIGSKGGVLKAGKNTFKVPPGALNDPVFISMETMGDNINHVVLKPTGLTFNKGYSAYLTLSYQDCRVAANTEQNVAAVNDELDVLRAAPSYTDPVSQTVEGKLTLFSDYVLLSTYAVVY